MFKTFISLKIIMVLIFVCSAASADLAQTTAFNYQGRLTDAGSPANGSYQLQFKLYDAASGGMQIGATVSDISLTAVNGVFTTQLDFGVSAFSGADRFLEIGVRHNAGENYTILSPRQQINSSPYSIRTLSAAQADIALDSNKLGGVDANQYVTTSSVGNSFINNATTQQTADFNISGNGIIGSNLGIGTTPQIDLRLDVNGSGRFRTANGNINFGTPNTEAGMTITNANRADFRFNGSTLKLLAGLGTSPPAETNGITVNTAGNVGIGTIIPQAKLHVAGNAAQDRDKGGMIKALLYVSGNGTIQRCYNGTTGTSTGNCGFSVTQLSSGNYEVNFGFQITDRFISVTTSSSLFINNINTGAQVGFDTRIPNTTIKVRTFVSYQEQSFYDSDFFITVY
jgi:hypothetical protein